jgi:hypothetical protein
VLWGSFDYHLPMSRRFRAFPTLAAIAALLFAQAVVSAYACTGPVADPVAMAQMKAQMVGDGGLCEKHCTTGTVSFELAKPAGFSMPALVPVALRVAVPQPSARVMAFQPAPHSVAGPAPPLICFTVLRI